MMRRFSLKAAVLAAALLLGALIPALAQQRGPGLVGDVNGDGRITSADALAVYAYLAGRPIPATFDVPGRGDADGDGQITRADAELIMRVAVGQASGDRPVGKPVVPGTPPAEGPLRLQCVANTRSATVRCSEPGAPTPAGVQGDRIIYGGQHVNVSLITDNVTTVADTFAFDMKVKNLLGQAIGTHDGVTMDSVKVFFDAEPRNTSSTPGNGTVTAVNHNGAQPFLSSEPQKYFAYGEIIQPQAISAARRWKLKVDPGVESFVFFLWVSSPVQHPNGYVDVYPDSAEISAGATLQLSDTVRNRLGRPVGGTVTWSSANPAIATVDANGLVTGVSDGTVVITGSTPNRSSGTMKLVVLTASADSSTLSASPTTLPVRDTSIVTLQLRSANGTPLTRSAGTVILGASAGSLSVTDNNNG
ncbi:MAG TPA: Ig-like domain-containing protein, partial [Longimicrobium sp.]|nr:Ig-like domain-containing protein [Longimicrobium sp.]